MGGIIGGVAALAGGIMGAGAAKSAASTESNAIGQGIQYAQGNYNQAAGNLQPFIGGGQQALQTLLGFYGLGNNPQGAAAGYQAFQNTPTYQFAYQQGLLGLNRQLAASGLSGSGAAAKEGAQFAQGLASQGLGSYLTGLSGLSSAGQNAATSLGQIGANVGATALQGYTNQGLAQGAGIVGANNALQQGIQGALSPLGSFAQGLFGLPQNLGSSSYNTGSSVGSWLGINGGNSIGTTNTMPAIGASNYSALGLPSLSWPGLTS
jgi:hypothetical protein